jgi:hypothetical protein
MRPVGEILLDMEELRQELIDDHGMQWGDLFYELYGWLEIHRPDAREEYVEGGHPVFYYGPEE